SGEIDLLALGFLVIDEEVRHHSLGRWAKLEPVLAGLQPQRPTQPDDIHFRPKSMADAGGMRQQTGREFSALQLVRVRSGGKSTRALGLCLPLVSRRARGVPFIPGFQVL